MSYYVKRNRPAREADVMRGLVEWTPKTSWTGPLPTLKRATREAEAWVDAGWSAEVLESNADVKREVREWAKSVRANRSTY